MRCFLLCDHFLFAFRQPAHDTYTPRRPAPPARAAGSSSSSKRIPLTPEETERYFPRATADSQSHRQAQTRVGSVSAGTLVLLSPPGQARGVNTRTATKVATSCCVVSTTAPHPLSHSFFVFRRARVLSVSPPLAHSLSRALSRAHSSVRTLLALEPHVRTCSSRHRRTTGPLKRAEANKKSAAARQQLRSLLLHP